MVPAEEGMAVEVTAGAVHHGRHLPEEIQEALTRGHQHPMVGAEEAEAVAVAAVAAAPEVVAADGAAD